VISVAMGIVILVAGDDQYVGLGGDLTWQVGDIPIAVAVGLLIGGVVLFAVMVAMAVAARGERVGRVEPKARPRQELISHATAFVIVNGFLWLQDIAAGGGLEYAWLTTLPWGIGLIAHALAYYGRDRTPASPRSRPGHPPDPRLTRRAYSVREDTRRGGVSHGERPGSRVPSVHEWVPVLECLATEPHPPVPAGQRGQPQHR
jgi:hypothetical protein